MPRRNLAWLLGIAAVGVFGFAVSHSAPSRERDRDYELVRLVEHITERLSGADDGKPRVFRDSAVTNLTEFFERFRTLNVRSNEQLDELVSRAQQVIGGVEPQQLRDNAVLRQRVVSQLAGVQSSLDGLLVDRPRRNILRRPQ